MHHKNVVVKQLKFDKMVVRSRIENWEKENRDVDGKIYKSLSDCWAPSFPL